MRRDAPGIRRIAAHGSRVAAVALLGVLLLGLQLARPAPARATAPSSIPQVGVNFHATWSDYTDQQRSVVAAKLAAAHVGWVRIDIGWSTIEQDCKGCISQWYVDVTDRAVDAALSHGLKVLGVLWRTPDWANGGQGPYAPPTRPSDYADAARWVAAHFAGRVSAWEVWNEPNEPGFWSGSEKQYVNLLKAAYPAIKQGDPNAQVVLGAPAYNDTKWLARLYADGGQGSFDVMATHPYQGQANLPPATPDTSGTDIYLLSHVAAVHDLMVAHGDGAKPVWFTEFGWSSHSNPGGEEPWSLGVTQRQQATYLTRAITYIGANFPYVTNVFWYNERDTSLGDAQQDNYGLLTKTLAAKPAYTALKTYMAAAIGAGTVIRG